MPPGVVIATRTPRHAASAGSAAEAAPLVHRYRRLLPRPLRRLLVLLTPDRIRAWLKGRASAAVRVPRALRRAGVLESGGCRVVVDRGRARPAVVSEALSPVLARDENERLVCAALEEAGIDHFAVRGYQNTSAAVGVCADDRPRVEAALAALCRRVPGYLSPPRREERTPQAMRWGGTAGAWQRLAAQPVIRFTCFRTDAGGALVLGGRYGCDIEFWERAGDRLTAPRPNRVTADLPAAADPVRAPGHLFSRLAPYTPGRHPRPRVRTRPEFTSPLPDDIGFPIDVVYTWVDCDDPGWRQRRAQVTDRPYHAEAANDARYLNRDELRYSLRSLHLYAPWVRHVYVVTDRQAPGCLNLSHPDVTLVDHREIFRDPDACLPTFNSHAIETQLHHIDGLAEHFLYFNDDVFLGRPVVPQDFFCPNGITKFFPSRALVPLGPPRADDIPSSVAGKNNRALLENRFGTVITQKMKHTPHALRRSLLAEIEAEFPEAHRRTAACRIRSMTDISVPSALHHYYAFQTGRAVPGSLRYLYLDLAHPDMAPKLDALLRQRSHHTFCINDTESRAQDAPDQASLLLPFLRSYFPQPGPLEASVPVRRRPRPEDGSGAGARDGAPLLPPRHGSGIVARKTARRRERNVK
ncbi:stealth family protein [Streptomyces sodiiphilus]|uniref:Stealth family protein n=1 Tax=Streptomyces sodiiphilus TaxID=226217 RepID=A0ABN2PTQ2_9ACTN